MRKANKKYRMSDFGKKSGLKTRWEFVRENTYINELLAIIEIAKRVEKLEKGQCKKK